MPEKETVERARRDRRQGKAPSTQAGEFVHAESASAGRKARRRVHEAGDRLSKARRAGILAEGIADAQVRTHLWAGAPATSIAIRATFFNSAGVAGT